MNASFRSAPLLLLGLVWGCGGGESPGLDGEGPAEGAVGSAGDAAGDAAAPSSATADPEVWFVDAAGETSRLLRWSPGEDGWQTLRAELPDASRGLAYDPDRARAWIPSRGEDLLLAGDPESDAWEAPPVAGLDSAYAVVRDVGADLLYLSDYGRDEILRLRPDGTEAEAIVIGLTAPRQLALDPDSRTLYWVDRGAGRVQGVTLGDEGAPEIGEVRTLVDDGLPAPYGIAWDAASRTLLVADAEVGAIYRVDPLLDRPILEPYLPEAGTHPSFLAIDEVAGVLYWTDNRDNVLRRRPLDGGEIEILAEGLAGPRGLVLIRR